ncbi:hypothetical protein [Oscillibacter sp.]|uniref:hypothetical protein n=1 Tax=Oscillibacter sp. TaxID=1945593 RepID=UPI002896EE09|nr:hypothetical protein [Oscillibacter sp.]
MLKIIYIWRGTTNWSLWNGGVALERVKRLDRYQKGVLLLMIAVVLAFTVIYPMTIAREGFAYENAILIPAQENGNTVYSGKIQGKQASFTVYTDKTVEFQYGDKIYGPYTAKEDPTAIPKDSEMGEYMTGVELRQGEKTLFRGGILDQGEYRWLYNEDGSIENIAFSVTTSNGIAMDENGNVIDPMEPTASAILGLLNSPELTHKGAWLAWFGGVFVCIVTAISILFVDELFRWNLAFQIRNVDRVEPSEWEIAGRYITWTVLPIVAMILFVMGLQ